MLLSRKFVSDYIDLPQNLTIEQIANDMTNVGNEYEVASPLINCTNLINSLLISNTTTKFDLQFYIISA